MRDRQVVLVLREDGLVLGAEALTAEALPVVVRWTEDLEELEQRLAHGDPPPESGLPEAFSKIA